MNMNRSKISYALSLVITIILSYLILIPPAYAINAVYNNGGSLSENFTDKTKPNKYSGKMAFLIAVFNENEFLTDVVSSHMISRNLQDYRRLLKVAFRVLTVMLTSFGVLLYFRKCFIREINPIVSVLALSKGGHAPPQVCMN